MLIFPIIFNLNQIDNELDKLFIFEGPIDACFVKNGIAVAGIQEGDATYTSKQQEQLQKYNLFDKIWVQPAAGDAGGSLGAALAFWHLEKNKSKP